MDYFYLIFEWFCVFFLILKALVPVFCNRMERFFFFFHEGNSLRTLATYLWVRNYDNTFPLNLCISLLFFLCNFYHCTFRLKRANRHVLFVRVLDMHIRVCWCFRALLHLSSLTFGCALFIFLSSEKNTFFPSEIPLWLLRSRGGDTSFGKRHLCTYLSRAAFPRLPPSLLPPSVLLSVSLNMDVIGGTEGSSDALPLENTPFLSCCQLWAGLYLTYLLHLPSPPPPYVLHTYLWHPHTSLYFYLLFYFVPVRQWWKITFQQQILPLSLSTILQIRFYVLVPQMWHIRTSDHSWIMWMHVNKSLLYGFWILSDEVPLQWVWWV